MATAIVAAIGNDERVSQILSAALCLLPDSAGFSMITMSKCIAACANARHIVKILRFIHDIEEGAVVPGEDGRYSVSPCSVVLLLNTPPTS